VNGGDLHIQAAHPPASRVTGWLVVLLLGVILACACASLLPPLLDFDWQGGKVASAPEGIHLVEKSRSLLAEYGFRKAMDYFHSGALPTMFDEVKPEDLALVKRTYKRGVDIPEDHWIKQSPDFGPPEDFLEKFGRHFYPTRHTHLSDGGTVAHGENKVREILPWYWLTAALDPHDLESYLEAAYWLRKEGGNTAEAAAFLRQGLQANPDSYEILFELGRIYEEDCGDVAHARTLWEIALQRWEKRNRGLTEQDEFPYRQIAGHLARLEDRQGNARQTLVYLELLKRFASDTAAIDRWMEDVRHPERAPKKAVTPQAAVIADPIHHQLK
jgi:tetratricopeptide (TPR) repeat protein